MPLYSQSRLESRILQGVGTMIVQREIKNPKLSSLVSVTRVELSSDNAYCTCYVSGAISESKLLQSVEALNRSKGFIQKKIAGILKTKNTPKLRFVPDESEKKRVRMDALIEEAMKAVRENDDEGK